MTRTADASVVTASKAEVVRWVDLVRLDFSGGVVAVNSGVSTLSYNGDDYLGTGALGSISQVQEGPDPRPYSISLTLSGVPPEYVAVAIGEHYQGRDARVYRAMLDAEHQLIGTPALLFRGRMDTMDIDMGEMATISVTAQSRLADWDRPRVRRYNHEDQITEYPNDKGFEFVAQMVSKELIWGRA